DELVELAVGDLRLTLTIDSFVVVDLLCQRLELAHRRLVVAGHVSKLALSPLDGQARWPQRRPRTLRRAASMEESLTEELKNRARELGFSHVGVAAAEALEFEGERLREYVE